MSKEENKRLCEEFPFLIPTNAWSGKRITDCSGPDGEKGFWPGNPEAHPEYDYEYTLLDDVPEGWRIAFGLEMCKEIKDELVKSNRLNDYYITQIKEKYGGLRWYDNGGSREHFDIIRKYEHKSEETCILCGTPASQISTGWISPYCDKCASKITNEHFINIKEYFREVKEV